MVFWEQGDGAIADAASSGTGTSDDKYIEMYYKYIERRGTSLLFQLLTSPFHCSGAWVWS